MDTSITVALIGVLGSLMVCLINNHTQFKKSQKQQEEHFYKIQAENQATQLLFQEKLTQLKEEVEKHNKVVERTYELEGDHRDYNRHFEAVDQRLKKLERYHEGE